MNDPTKLPATDPALPVRRRTAPSGGTERQRGWGLQSARRIVPLAWPVFVGQVSALAFATFDTVLLARASAVDLAALAVGTAAYVTVFVGFMGVLMALAPIVGQLFGAGRLHDAAHQARQGLWLALGLSAIGVVLLGFPQPFLALSKSGPEVAARVHAYLLMLAIALPASLLFTVFRAFNIAVSRPRAVMNLQIGALLVKLPLSWLLVTGWPAAGVPALGIVGCGIATAVAYWLQIAGAAWLLKRDPFYDRFGRATGTPGWPRPERAALAAQLRLGVPMGLSIMVEVTGFAFMAIFIARLGTLPVAGHQIAVNLVSLLFMVPLAWGSATGALVAQRIGAGDRADARRLGEHGLLLGCAVAAVLGLVVFVARQPLLALYTNDALVAAAALPLMAWLAVFHVFDAAQTIAAYVLRAWKVAVVPVVIYVAALWGVGLGGGWWLAFDVSGTTPAALTGAPGYWFASTAGLMLAGVLLSAFMVGLARQKSR